MLAVAKLVVLDKRLVVTHAAGHLAHHFAADLHRHALDAAANRLTDGRRRRLALSRSGGRQVVVMTIACASLALGTSTMLFESVRMRRDHQLKSVT